MRLLPFLNVRVSVVTVPSRVVVISDSSGAERGCSAAVCSVFDMFDVAVVVVVVVAELLAPVVSFVVGASVFVQPKFTSDENTTHDPMISLSRIIILLQVI